MPTQTINNLNQIKIKLLLYFQFFNFVSNSANNSRVSTSLSVYKEYATSKIVKSKIQIVETVGFNHFYKEERLQQRPRSDQKMKIEVYKFFYLPMSFLGKC